MTFTVLIVWALLALVLLVLLLAAKRPDHFRIERSLLLDATPAQAQALVLDFHRWADWSPWENLDPTMERNYAGAASGVGAIYSWSSKGKAGAGRMEITQADAAQVQIQLDFLKPFAAHNIAEFHFTPQGTQTQVLWAMHGPSPFVSKLMGVFINIDRMVGRDFEQGLRNLQQRVTSA